MDSSKRQDGIGGPRLFCILRTATASSMAPGAFRASSRASHNAALPQRRAGELFGVVQGGFALQLRPSLFNTAGQDGQGLAAKEPAVGLDIRIDRPDLHPVRPQVARQGRKREIRRRGIAGRRVDQGNFHHGDPGFLTNRGASVRSVQITPKDQLDTPLSLKSTKFLMPYD